MSPDRRPLARTLGVYVATMLAVVLLFQLGGPIPFIGRNLPVAVAIVFLYVPVAIAWRRGEDASIYGFTFRPLGRSLAFAAGTLAVVFPLFLIGFVGYHLVACRSGRPDLFTALVPEHLCRRFVGWAGLSAPHGPADFLETALAQLVVVALPEELFFRGYLLSRLEDAWTPRRRLLGGSVGKALVVSSLLFAIGHVVVDPDPLRLAVFFPGLLFGWMRSATGSVLPGTLVHAGANLYIEALHRTFFR